MSKMHRKCFFACISQAIFLYSLESSSCCNLETVKLFYTISFPASLSHFSHPPPSEPRFECGLALISCTFNHLKYRNLEYRSSVCCAESTNPLCIPPWRFKRIMMLGYVIKANLHTHKGTQRQQQEVDPQ